MEIILGYLLVELFYAVAGWAVVLAGVLATAWLVELVVNRLYPPPAAPAVRPGPLPKPIWRQRRLTSNRLDSA